jgi:hypothetical protein
MEDMEPQPSPRPATERQRDYIRDLMAKVELTDDDKAKINDGLSTLSLTNASVWIDSLRAKPQVKKSKWIVPAEIPDGRYAITKNKVWTFFRVVTRNAGEPTEQRFVQKVLGSPGDFRYVRVTTEEWRLAIDTIRDDPGTYATLFGLKVGVCGICGSPLTDPDSIARGIGPICAQKYDW